MQTTERLLVIGGDAAGMSAASQARRLRADLEIVAFERGAYTSYSACGMPYYVGGVVADVEPLIARTPEEFVKRGIRANVRHEVESIDLNSRRIQVRRLEDRAVLSEAFDHLVIATGAVPIRPSLPGIDASGIYGLGILEDGIRVRQAVERDQPAKAVIVGGGYIGLEMAEALIMRGLQVSLVERASAVMSTLDTDMGEIVSQALRDIGVTLCLEESVEGFETDNGRVTGVKTDRHMLPADLVILGIGTRPNTSLARDAAITARQVVLPTRILARRVRSTPHRRAGRGTERRRDSRRHSVAG